VRDQGVGPLGHSAARRGSASGRKGFFRMLTELVKSPPVAPSPDRAPRYIPIDATVEVPETWEIS
jgi:hypothetical protein